jgi:rod shape-determining protein MreC
LLMPPVTLTPHNVITLGCMFTIRRWWERFGLQTVFVGAALGTALLIRQTQAGMLMETYQMLTRGFQGSPPTLDRLTNARTLELQQRLIELENKNQRLEEMLGFKSSKAIPGIAAPVIGRSADHWWQQVVLGRGSEDGIKEGAIVISPGGLVGRITAVTAHTSQVLLLSDPSSHRVGISVSRSRSMGLMRGQASNRAVIEFFDKVPDVRRGDVVSTSVLSRFFPAGLPVGRIESVDLSKSPAPEAVVELSAPMSALEWVVVYPNSPDLKTTPELANPALPQVPATPTSSPSPAAASPTSLDPATASPTASPTEAPRPAPESTPEEPPQ